MSAVETLCACGCGAVVTPDERGRARRFIRNHHRTGIKDSPETVCKRVEAVKRAWADPSKMVAVRHQSPELVERRMCKIRGRKIPAERVARQREAVKAAWAAGKYDGKCGGSAEHMASIRRFIDMDKFRADQSKLMASRMKEWKESGQLDEIRRKAGNATGMPDHMCAKAWTIRDPRGVLFSFSNLSEWARQHAHLFEDCAPASRQPHWRRIAGGIGELLTKGRSCSYRGWVAVSKSELETGAPDLLARDTEAKP